MVIKNIMRLFFFLLFIFSNSCHAGNVLTCFQAPDDGNNDTIASCPTLTLSETGAFPDPSNDALQINPQLVSCHPRLYRTTLFAQYEAQTLYHCFYFLSRHPAEIHGQPTMDDFFRRGYLVRACTLNFQQDWDGRVPVSHERPCSYWTFNTVVPVNYSDKFNGANAFIISPFAKRWGNVISISFPEVMVAGDVLLGAGDIVLLNRDQSDWICNNPTFRAVCARKGIIVTCYKGGKYAESKDLNEPRRIVNTLIKELDGWEVEMPLEFWTPTTPAKVNQRPVHPLRFFQAVLEARPVMSFGSEYYSYKGKASLISKASTHFSGDPTSTLYPRFVRILAEHLKNMLSEYFEQFSDFDGSAQRAVREFLATQPSAHTMDERFKVSAAVEELAYQEAAFIMNSVHYLSALSDRDYTKLRARIKLPAKTTTVFDTLFYFSKWAQGLSPALVHFDELPRTIELPDKVNRAILKKLPLEAKANIFRDIFQLYHDKGEVDLEQALAMFDNPEGFFQRLYEIVQRPTGLVPLNQTAE